ncbi:MAG: hypothetical protein HC915_00350 [Anaerolineae bacterium]|nr:hypothetical protein [Anaerolineae bacterium]
MVMVLLSLVGGLVAGWAIRRLWMRWQAQRVSCRPQLAPAWSAPPEVVEAVARDYLAFYRYASQRLPNGWLPYLRDLHLHLCDEMLRNQRNQLDERLRHDRGRVVDILRAHHRVEVRHFGADRHSCIVIDYQTDRRLATYDYWSGARLHTQDIGNAGLVFAMRYDDHSATWKIARYIQTLPQGVTQVNGLDMRVSEPLRRD